MPGRTLFPRCANRREDQSAPARHDCLRPARARSAPARRAGRGGMSDALEGVRVLELVRNAPGELPGMFFGDMGADVIKIETPDPGRDRDPRTRRREAFAYTNRNKRSIALDLKSAEGKEALLALARTADVLVEGFRPGVMKRLGLDYESLGADNPRLVYCSMSGFGQSGPYRDRAAHDV